MRVACSARPQATEYTEAWTTFANVEKTWAYRQDQLPSTHPVAADIPDLQAVEVNFDGITYAKGASVLKQLVAYVGLEPFLAGLRSYFAAHAWGNATFDDLLGALEQASGRDLSGWGAQWLQTTGLNMLRPSFERRRRRPFTRFEVVQGGARPGAGELRTHRIAVGVYDDADGAGKLVRTHRVEVDVTGERTAGARAGRRARAASSCWSTTTTSPTARCASTRARSPRSIDRIGDIAEPLPRTLCWSAAWEMTREAELQGPRLHRARRGRLRRRVRDRRACSGCCCRPRPPSRPTPTSEWAAERGWPLLVDALRFRLDTAPPGSDAQLAVVNSLGRRACCRESVLDAVPRLAARTSTCRTG